MSIVRLLGGVSKKEYDDLKKEINNQTVLFEMRVSGIPFFTLHRVETQECGHIPRLPRLVDWEG